jgi:hypothetical protein
MRKVTYQFPTGSVRVLTMLALFLGLSLISYSALAQCFMCRASVEAARQERDDYDISGLNKGILYMAAIPYLLMGAIGYLWYRRTHLKAAVKPTPKLAHPPLLVMSR